MQELYPFGLLVQEIRRDLVQVLVYCLGSSGPSWSRLLFQISAGTNFFPTLLSQILFMTACCIANFLHLETSIFGRTMYRIGYGKRLLIIVMSKYLSMMVLISCSDMSWRIKGLIMFIAKVMTSDQPGLQLEVMRDGKVIAVIPVAKYWNLATLHHILLQLGKNVPQASALLQMLTNKAKAKIPSFLL